MNSCVFFQILTKPIELSRVIHFLEDPLAVCDKYLSTKSLNYY